MKKVKTSTVRVTLKNLKEGDIVWGTTRKKSSCSLIAIKKPRLNLTLC